MRAAKCCVMLQKSSCKDGLIEEECGELVKSSYRWEYIDLHEHMYTHKCWYRRHYREYLTFKINQNHIDPLPLYETGSLRAILMRDEVTNCLEREKASILRDCDRYVAIACRCVIMVHGMCYTDYQRKTPLKRRAAEICTYLIMLYDVITHLSI